VKSALLLLVGVLLALSSAAAQGKKQELRGSEPLWVLAGKKSAVRLYGQDLSPKEIRFADPRITAKLLKMEPLMPKTDEERRRGNTVVEVEVGTPPGFRPGSYRFELVPDTGEPEEGRLLIDVEAPEVRETEPNNSLTQPQALSDGSITVLGKLDSDGVDVFRFEGRAGETWRFEVFARRLKPANTLEACLRLRDPRRAPIKVAVDEGNDCALELKLPATGPYLLELFDGDNRADPAFEYRLTLRKL
jgi:hypothetical protein